MGLGSRSSGCSRRSLSGSGQIDVAHPHQHAVGSPPLPKASMNPSGEPFVRLQGVSKSYGSSSGALHLLESVDLDLPVGQTTSLLGRSGSGKSTLLSLIAGLMRPDTGCISI